MHCQYNSCKSIAWFCSLFWTLNESESELWMFIGRIAPNLKNLKKWLALRCRISISPWWTLELLTELTRRCWWFENFTHQSRLVRSTLEAWRRRMRQELREAWRRGDWPGGNFSLFLIWCKRLPSELKFNELHWRFRLEPELKKRSKLQKPLVWSRGS